MCYGITTYSSAALSKEFVEIADAGKSDVKCRRLIVTVGKQIVVLVVEVTEQFFFDFVRFGILRSRRPKKVDMVSVR
jgi:hypothetical protein